VAELPLALRLRVLGPGGGDWRLVFAAGRLAEVESEPAGDAAGEVTMTGETFRRLADRALSPVAAAECGALAIAADIASPRDLLRVLDAAFSPPA
jgi:hypothetical protein